MSRYQHVLVAVDVTDEAPQVLAHAIEQAQEHDARLSVMTVVRPINYGYAGMDIGWATKDIVSFEQEATRHAEARLRQLIKGAGVPSAEVHVFLGTPAHTIKSQAQQLDADLIVLGTHSRHGLGVLLGSTATGVLHGATCDVLAVKIEQDVAVAA